MNFKFEFLGGPYTGTILHGGNDFAIPLVRDKTGVPVVITFGKRNNDFGIANFWGDGLNYATEYSSANNRLWTSNTVMTTCS